MGISQFHLLILVVILGGKDYRQMSGLELGEQLSSDIKNNLRKMRFTVEQLDRIESFLYSGRNKRQEDGLFFLFTTMNR